MPDYVHRPILADDKVADPKMAAQRREKPRPPLSTGTLATANVEALGKILNGSCSTTTAGNNRNNNKDEVTATWYGSGNHDDAGVGAAAVQEIGTVPVSMPSTLPLAANVDVEALLNQARRTKTTTPPAFH